MIIFFSFLLFPVLCFIVQECLPSVPTMTNKILVLITALLSLRSVAAGTCGETDSDSQFASGQCSAGTTVVGSGYCQTPGKLAEGGDYASSYSVAGSVSLVACRAACIEAGPDECRFFSITGALDNTVTDKNCGLFALSDCPNQGTQYWNLYSRGNNEKMTYGLDPICNGDHLGGDVPGPRASTACGGPCTGTFTDNESSNHFTANCAGQTTHGSTCVVTDSAGFAGGTVTCDTSSATYTVVPATATPCTGTFTDNESSNHFTANCADQETHGSTCVVTDSAGFAGGTVTCDTATGLYTVVPATATPCTGTFTDNESSNHFTADCAGQTTHDSTCVVTNSAGFTGGTVTCDTATGFYTVVVATADPCASDFTTTNGVSGGANTASGASYVFSCDNGYTASGAATCTLGNWDSPTCSANPCTPTQVANSNKKSTGAITGDTIDVVVITCDDGFFTSGRGDMTCEASGVFTDAPTCETCTDVTNKVAAATLTCTSATTSQVSACAEGFWKSIANAAHTCSRCTAVDGAATGATYTCTSAADSRVSACATATPTKTVGGDGATDTCVVLGSSSTSTSSSVLSPSSAAEAAEAAESSRRQQMIDAATAAAGISPMIIILAICGVFVALAALYVCFHNKKHSAAASVENRSDLEQPKMVVELTVNPMKEAK